MAPFLVQHGKSLSREIDPDQCLSAEGIAEVERLAQVVWGYGVKVARIIHSGKKGTEDAEDLKHLTGLLEIKDELTDQKKLAVIEKVYKELSASDHPVFIVMEKQKTVPEIRIIEGLDT